MATIIPQPDIEDLDYCGKLTASEINGEATYMQAVIDSYETAYNIQIQRVVANAVDLVYVVDEDMSYLRINTVSATIPDYISIYQHATKDNTVRVYENIGETTLDVVGGTYTCYRTGGNFLDEVMAGGAYYMVCPTTETEATEPGPAEPTGDGYLDYPGLDYYTRRIKEELAEKLEAYKKRADLGKVFVYKGSVDNYEDLPTDGLEIGHVYNVVNAYPDKDIKAGDNVCWNGEDWDDLAGKVDTSELLSLADAAGMKEEVQAAIDAIKDKLGNYILKNAADEVIGEYLTWEELLASFEVVTDDEVYALFENGGGGEPLEPTNGTLDIEGDFELGEDFRVNGNVVVTGDITGSGTLYATGTITCNGTISATVKEGASLSECDISVDDGTTTFTASAVLADGILSTTQQITNEAICVINCNVTIIANGSNGIYTTGNLTITKTTSLDITITNTDGSSGAYGCGIWQEWGSGVTIEGYVVIVINSARSAYGIYCSYKGDLFVTESAVMNITCVSTDYSAYGISGAGSSSARPVISIEGAVTISGSGVTVYGLYVYHAEAIITAKTPLNIAVTGTNRYTAGFNLYCYASTSTITIAEESKAIITSSLNGIRWYEGKSESVIVNGALEVTATTFSRNDSGSSSKDLITGTGTITFNGEPYDF